MQVSSIGVDQWSQMVHFEHFTPMVNIATAATAYSDQPIYK